MVLEFPLGCDRISIKLGLNFDKVGTNNAITHVLVLSAKVRRNERL